MKGLSAFLFLLVVVSACPLQAQDVIRVKRPDTCGIRLVADTTLTDQTVQLSIFKISGLTGQKEMDEMRSNLRLGEILTVSMDSVCKYVNSVKETKKHRLVEVKIIHIDEPSVTIYKYAMITLVYIPKNLRKDPEKKTDATVETENTENTETAESTEETASQEE
jgi:hypothetical protein